jgi:hypothetical protein
MAEDRLIKKKIIVQKARVYTGDGYRTQYCCYPRLYVDELNTHIQHGVHKGKTPEICINKVLKLLRNLKVDLSKYEFEVKE